MTVKIFLNQNNSCQFEQSDGVKDTMTAGSLVSRFESGRVRFSYSASGVMFRDYALSEIQDEAGVAYQSQALFEAAMADFLIQTNAPVELLSHVCSQNCTSTPLAANATFTGVWDDTSAYGTIVIGIIADQASAANGFVVEYSSDGVTVEQNDSFSIQANNGKTFSFGMANRYFRVKYTNGPIPQTSFDIQTILKTASIKDSSHKIDQPIIGDDDATLVKSVITGKRDDDTFGNCRLDNENRLQVNAQPYAYAIAEGVVSGHTSLLKFGTRAAIAANTPSTIWNGTAPLYTYLSAASTLSVVSSSAQDGVAGTGVLTLTIVGLDANFVEQSETITMNGVGAVVTTKSFRRAFRAYAVTCGTSGVNVGNITITSSVGAIQIIYIPAGNGQTLMCLWTVPLDKVAYLTQMTVSNDSGKGAEFSLYMRANNGGTIYPWQIKYRGYILGGTSVIPFNIPFKISAKTDMEIRFTTPASAGVTAGGATFELWYEDAD